MNRSNKSWRPLDTAKLSWTKANSPRSVRFEDIYYSSENGLEESQYVFLAGNQLPQRWSAHPHSAFRIVETGFGTGLNFLLTWQAWQKQTHPRPHLHFISIEKNPLDTEDLRRALASWPELKVLATPLVDSYPPPIPGQHRIVLEGGAVTLDLWWEDAQEALLDMASHRCCSVDCWYLDGFAPRQNPTMWTDTLFQSMAAISRSGATFATFTAAGFVRRGLEEAGFGVSRLPGFGKKRENLHGEIVSGIGAGTVRKPDTITPWDIGGRASSAPESALVVGAGIAGCMTAAALARRNIRVVLVEAGQLAGAGSGNDQGVLYTRLSTRHSPLSDFSLQSFLYANRYYRQLFSSGMLREHLDGSLCGSFHQSDKRDEMAALQLLLQSVPELAQVLSAAEANSLLGIAQQQAGYWYPGSGWMHPGAVCRAVLQDRNIKLLENTGSIELQGGNGGWTATAGDQAIAEGKVAIVAAGTSTGQIAGLDWLPLQAIRGQTTTLPSRGELTQLRAALCHKGYISPAREGSHCIGATFNIEDNDASTRAVDHRKNLDSLATAVPHWQSSLEKLDAQELQGRVGYRCASPDYLPLVGPVPDRTIFLQEYAALRKNARRVIATEGRYRPNLYISTGHGSRGLSSAPLAAEILASLICDEPLPLSRELYRAIAPGRFLIRDLKRKHI